MLTLLIYTVVVLICFWILTGVINTAPFGDAKVKWGLYAIAALIAVVIVLNIWGLVPATALK